MNRLLAQIPALILLAVGQVQAQHEPQFTHFTWNRFVYNPAVAGGRDSLCATFVYHNQWASFSGPDEEGAPVTATVSMHSRLKQKFGIGMHGIHHEEGFVTTVASYASGAYQVKVGPGVNLGIGLSAGLIRKSLDPKWRPRDMGDSRLPGGTSRIAFDGGTGLHLAADNWYLGASALHITQSRIAWKTSGPDISYPLQRSYWFTGGYSFQGLMGEKLDLTPAALVRTDFAKTSLSANLQALYKKSVFLGVNYRNEYLTAVSAMAGFYIKRKIALGYSFDLPVSNISIFGGTHEIMFQFCQDLDALR